MIVQLIKTTSATTSVRKLLGLTLVAQSLTLLLIASVLYSLNRTALDLKSGLFGACLYLLPNIYFCCVFWLGQGQRPVDLIKKSYRAQAHKSLLTVLGFGLVFSYAMPINAPILFAAYGVMLISQQVVAYFCTKYHGA